MSLDERIVEFFATHRTPLETDFFVAMTNLGGAAIVVLVLLCAYYILWKSKRWPYAVGLMVSLAGSLTVSSLLKIIVARARPDVSLRAITEIGYSFPSNHATAALALYGFLTYAIWKCAPHTLRSALIALCAAAILLIGVSRVYLGVHYPSDVIAGYAIGYLFVLLGIHVTGKLNRFTVRQERI